LRSVALCDLAAPNDRARVADHRGLRDSGWLWHLALVPACARDDQTRARQCGDGIGGADGVELAEHQFAAEQYGELVPARCPENPTRATRQRAARARPQRA